ncbi:PAS-domain containing protein [Celeribacter arenosi]|uniref:PAS-domain containing protein n=1 Tax=Celeribacter arenosi TaxID=792649 RepID=A0ABP7JYK7_9RHOB
MPTSALITLVMLAMVSFLISMGVLSVLTALGRRSERREALQLNAPDSEMVFLFDDERLVSATESARHIMSSAADVGSDWSRFLSVMLSRFPELNTQIAALAETGRITIDARDGMAVLKCEWRNGLARIAFAEEAGDMRGGVDRFSMRAMEEELETLRETAHHVPFPVWRELRDGTITWANSAYLALADADSDGSQPPTWPPARVFKVSGEDGLASQRVEVVGAKSRQWFDVTRREMSDGVLFSASPADRTVRAEAHLSEFVQTLTKTFSHLTVGLAVFDRSRKLALFNPALGDLTRLPVDFLITRPDLAQFLDRLRDSHMMPEPKDYKSWRQAIEDLEAAARDGSYEEVWSLPGDVTYRVSGRPHPDGAIAFLFEDISAEITLTRRFRSEIDTAHHVIDSLSEAIAVFGPDGALLVTNSAYDTLWGSKSMETVQVSTIQEATRLWHGKCAPTPLWTQVRESIGHGRERREISGSTRAWDGRRIACRVVPLPHGQTLVGFTSQQQGATPLPLGKPKVASIQIAEI